LLQPEQLEPGVQLAQAGFYPFSVQMQHQPNKIPSGIPTLSSLFFEKVSS
jgi:hypothetical protein